MPENEHVSASAQETNMEKQTETFSMRAPQPIKEAWARLTEEQKAALKFEFFLRIAKQDNENLFDRSLYGLSE